MAAVSMAAVKELRERLGAGMLDSKNALVEADGDIEKAIEILRSFSIGENASLIGRVGAQSLRAQAILKNPFGTRRPLQRLVGDQLPRIC